MLLLGVGWGLLLGDLGAALRSAKWPHQPWRASLGSNLSHMALLDFLFHDQLKKIAFKVLICFGQAHPDNRPILRSAVPYNVTYSQA